MSFKSNQTTITAEATVVLASNAHQKGPTLDILASREAGNGCTSRASVYVAYQRTHSYFVRGGYGLSVCVAWSSWLLSD
jgi:hypothetical protein